MSVSQHAITIICASLMLVACADNSEKTYNKLLLSVLIIRQSAPMMKHKVQTPSKAQIRTMSMRY